MSVCNSLYFLPVTKNSSDPHFLSKTLNPFSHSPAKTPASMAGADWAHLPWPALDLISKLLSFSLDYARFRSVCTSWRSAAPKRRHLPLLAGHLTDDDGLLTIFNFSDFTGSEIIPISGDSQLAETPLGGRLCCGWSHGWMALLDPSPGINLWNPITRSHIELPSLTDYPDVNEGRTNHAKFSKVGDEFVIRFGESAVRSFRVMQKYLASKLILSCDPSTGGNCMALLLRCRWRRLAICRLGADDAWIPVQFSEFRNFNTDALFYKGRFYVICWQALYVLNLVPELGLERVLMANPPFDELSTLPEIDECYLVESSGDLLVVYAYYLFPYVVSRAYRFEVYKVDWGVHRVKMLKVRSLGDRALFLGRNSISLSAREFPGCRANCIYLAEYYQRDKSEVRMYNMEDGSNDFIDNPLADPSSGWRACTWVIPNLM